MSQTTLDKIQTKIQRDPFLSDENKSELLKLLGSLKSEIAGLSETHEEHAESIAGFVERSAHEATRRMKNPTLLNLAISGLVESVKGFEESHPKLVEDVNYVSTVLANMGI